MVQARGNANTTILDTLRQLEARLDAMETAQRRGAHLDDVSDDEVVEPNPNPKLEEDQDEARLLRVLSRAHSKLALEVVSYDRKLDT